MERENQPGTARFGNFINYYSFNPAEKRLDLIPDDLLTLCAPIPKEKFPVLVLDVGCNTGDLTASLRPQIFPSVASSDLKILGVDLDPVLIDRSRVNHTDECLTFEVADLMHHKCRSEVINNFLVTYQRRTFDLVTCFSVTLWIHINHGDDGLRDFLRYISSISHYLIIEPQPWKCYRTAMRRMMRNGCSAFPKFETLVWRTDVDENISSFLCGECGMTIKKTLGTTDWGRKLLLFEKKELTS